MNSMNTGTPNRTARTYIDVDRFIGTQKGGIFVFIKKIVSFLAKKYIHQDELNEMFYSCKDFYGIDWVHAILSYLHITVTVINEQYLAEQGKCVYVCNHPLGGLDGLAVLSAVGKYHAAIKSLSHDDLKIIPNVMSFILPVSCHSANTRAFAKSVDELFRSDIQVLIFPAGVVSRKVKGKPLDLEWTKTFFTKGREHGRSIVPIYIDAQNTTSFYTFSALRRKLQDLTGIRLEMFSIVRESLKHKNATFNLIIGKPITPKTFDASYSAYDWTQKIKNYVYQLKENSNAIFKK